MAVSKVILNGNTLMDTTDKTVTSASMLSGVTALKNDGTTVTGNIANGSATTPTTTITANPTISVNSSTGLITASVSGSQSVTPTVSAGYVSSGTAGTVSASGSNTSQLTAKSAQTYTPTTTDQTIASGMYLTGTQTIKGDANLVAANIKKDVVLFGVTGTLESGGASITHVSSSYSSIGATIVYLDENGVAQQYDVGDPMSPAFSVNSISGSLITVISRQNTAASITNATLVTSRSSGSGTYRWIGVFQVN